MAKDRSLYSEFLSYFDFYGTQPTIFLNNNKKRQTIMGSFFTLCTIAIACGLTGPIFFEYIYGTNPAVSYTNEYGQNFISFDYSSLFFSLSFYYPSNITDTNDTGILSVAPNNYSVIQYINEMYISCTQCNEDFTQTRMNLCASSQFLDTTIKSVSQVKSKNIVEIFRNYSFCFPQGISGNIMDEVAESARQDTSLTLSIQ
jgi:hypothetical protein